MTDHENARPFNLGSDARLAGLSRAENPYKQGTISRTYWFYGWDDVDSHWGLDTPGTRQRLRPVYTGTIGGLER